MKKSLILSSLLSINLLVNANIHEAIMQGNMNEVMTCLESCDIEARNSFGETPLCTACRCGKIEIMEMLISKGAQINSQDNYGMSPLHLALGHYCERIENSQNVIMKFLDYAPNVNAKDKRGETPLHFAIMHELDACVIEKMLNMGADITVPNRHGKTAYRMAKEEKMEDILQVFKKCCMITEEENHQ
ncbi:ankyrin repeat domain-containing protein [Candidatus Dependentiae bacterium]|nr:ankyrin repeat domain-containing protein [Candidatus Dependentiae bacterium]